MLSFVAGGILQVLTKNIFLAFSMIFAGAAISRFFSAYFLSQMVEPPVVAPKSKQASIFELSRTLGSTNIGKFIVFNALLIFSTNLASPFFSVYMLSDLKFSYLTYFIATAIPTLVTLLCIPFWGKRIDRNGNIKVLKATPRCLSRYYPFYGLLVQMSLLYMWSAGDLRFCMGRM